MENALLNLKEHLNADPNISVMNIDGCYYNKAELNKCVDEICKKAELSALGLYDWSELEKLAVAILAAKLM